jgi:hypothetical protein
MKTVSILLYFMFFFSVNAYAYIEETHQELSLEALKISDIATNLELLQDLGLDNFNSNQTFPSPKNTNSYKSIRNLFRDGAKFEDKFPRSLSHFYNPINNTPGTGGDTSPDWALEDNADIDPVKNGPQEYSYKDGMNYFYQALTSQTKQQRDESWGKVFQTLGQVIHHIQDMAQPDHARNDAHCNHTLCALVMVLYDKSYYESYTDELRSEDNAVLNALMTANNYPIPTFSTAREFWTTRDDFALPDRKGLADFTNRNFVSKDTMFEINDGLIVAHDEFPYPEPDVIPNRVDIASADMLGPVGEALCNSVKTQAIMPFPPTACFIDFVSTPLTDENTGEQTTNSRAASYSIFDKKLQDHNIDAIYTREDGSIDTIDRSFTLNKFNFDAAHNYLIPRAVAYSAGLINHFFRGKIDMVPNTNGVGWIIQNKSDEEMQGTFTLYYDHVDLADDIEKRDIIPGAIWNLTIAANSEVVVGEYIVPAGVIRKTLVFQGRIGVEDNVVTGKEAGGWSEPIAVGVMPRPYNKADVAIDASGNAMVLYHTTDNIAATWSLWSRRYTPAGGWGIATLIDNSSNANSYNKKELVMDASGNAMIVYSTRTDDSVPVLWSRRYTPVDGWSSATFIDIDNIDGDIGNGQLILDASGNAMLTYHTIASTYESPTRTWTWNLWSRRYTPAGSWGVATLIDSSSHTYYSNHVYYNYQNNQVVIDSSGNAMVTYHTYDSANFANATWGLWSRRYTLVGGWSSATRLINNTGYNYNYNQLAMDASGNAMVMYRIYDSANGSNNWWNRLYTPAAGWGAAVAWSDGDSQIDMDSSGNAIALFSGSEENTSSVKHYAPSVGWGDEIQLSVNQLVTPAAILSLDVEANGKAVVVWRDSTGNLWSNFYVP